MTGSKRRILAAVLSLASISAANGQSSSTKLEPEVARNLFGIYAACRAYWKVMTQCLPSGLEPKDYARVRKSFDQLQSVGVEHMKTAGCEGTAIARHAAADHRQGDKPRIHHKQPDVRLSVRCLLPSTESAICRERGKLTNGPPIMQQRPIFLAFFAPSHL
jgi:hypothetical protein